MKLIFKVGPAKKNGRSPIEIILQTRHKLCKQAGSSVFCENTDDILSTLDKLLKRSKMEIKDIKRGIIKLEINKRAGLTSQRIIKTIIKALSLNLY